MSALTKFGKGLMNADDFAKQADELKNLKRIGGLDYDNAVKRFSDNLLDNPQVIPRNKSINDVLTDVTGVRTTLADIRAKVVSTESLPSYKVSAANKLTNDVIEDVNKGLTDSPAITKLNASMKEIDDFYNVIKDIDLDPVRRQALAKQFPEMFDNKGKLIPTSQRSFHLKSIQDLNDQLWDIPGKIKRNPKTAGIIIGGVTVGSILLHMHLQAQQINKKEYIITSIEKDPKTEKTIIRFEPEDEIVPGDKLTISQSNCTPHIDGRKNPTSYNQPGITEIDEQITQNGNFGILRIKTSAEKRTRELFDQLGSTVAAVPAGAAKGALDTALGIFGLGGLGEVGMWLSWGCLICCILVCLIVSVILVMRFSD